VPQLELLPQQQQCLQEIQLHQGPVLLLLL
jgi:hypothetical protein